MDFCRQPSSTASYIVDLRSTIRYPRKFLCTARIAGILLQRLHRFLPRIAISKRSEASTGDSLAAVYDGTSFCGSQGLGCDLQEQHRDRGATGNSYPSTHPFGGVREVKP